MVLQAKWMLKRCKKDVKAIAKMTGISEVVASILANREITTQEEIKSFINPSMTDLQNPLLMKDMEKGVDIIYRAIKEEKNIAV